MKELLFEEKGTWLRLNIEEIKVLWDSNELDYRKWPESISKFYAKNILEHAKKLNNQKKQLELFFEAKGVLNKKRLYKELFRNIPWDYSEEDLIYIEQTKKEAEEFFQIKTKDLIIN